MHASLSPAFGHVIGACLLRAAVAGACAALALSAAVLLLAPAASDTETTGVVQTRVRGDSIP